jgi:hypothetical protein
VAELQIQVTGYALDSGSPGLRGHVGRAPSPAAGPLAGPPAGGRGRPPRSRGTAPPGRCQSDYLSQAHTQFQVLTLLLRIAKQSSLRARYQTCYHFLEKAARNRRNQGPTRWIMSLKYKEQHETRRNLNQTHNPKVEGSNPSPPTYFFGSERESVK